jgi:5'-3' exonuclease
MDCRSGYDVRYYCLNKKSFLRTDDVVEKWSVKRPSHIAIALAILGDQGDGISGIKGWGPVKVAKLFESVTPEMSFEEAVLEVDSQIPDGLKQTYYDCLEATILHQDAFIESGPKKINWRHPSELDGANLSEIKGQYSTGYYDAIPSSDDLI